MEKEIQVKKRDRTLYVDIIRIVAIFFVVVLHVCAVRWFASYNPETMTEWWFLNTFVCLFRLGVPIFFMVSGMVHLDPNYKSILKKIYTKSIPRLLFALIFWSIIYIILSPYTDKAANLQYNYSDMTNWYNAYKEIFFGIPWYHLWFMYPIIGMYIMTPLFRVFTEYAKREHYIYFIILFLIFGSIIPMLNTYFSFNFSFKIDELHSFFGFFIIGYFFNKYDLKKNEKTILYILGIVSLAALYFIPTYLTLKKGVPNSTYFDRLLPQIVLASFFVFIYIKNFVNGNKTLQKYQNNKYITLVAKCGFGIYLVHDIFIIILNNFLHLYTNTIPAIIAIPLYSIIVYGSSLGLILIIQKIPVLNKWII